MEYEFDVDPDRIPRDAVWRWLSTEAYWGRWRSRADLDAQLDSAWRVVGVYQSDSGAFVGFARAVSDGVSFGYLADVFIVEGHRGRGLGHALVRTMIDEGPGAHFRWVLFTRDAHEVYRRFGFSEPDDTAMVRPATVG